MALRRFLRKPKNQKRLNRSGKYCILYISGGYPVLKILIKAAILVFIILSVYFIVNPYACSNIMLGRVTNSMEVEPYVETQTNSHSELFVPTGDQPLAAPQEGVFDTNTMNAPEIPAYTQEDIDYAVASRYVELENEYAKKNTLGTDTAKEISYIVMDDFELTQQEWESFLQRATETNLFNKVRNEQALITPAP